MIFGLSQRPQVKEGGGGDAGGGGWTPGELGTRGGGILPPSGHDVEFYRRLLWIFLCPELFRKSQQ